jgi:hypothetical protein
VKRTGDGSIVEFRSVVDAVRRAIVVQNGMVDRSAGLPPERRGGSRSSGRTSFRAETKGAALKWRLKSSLGLEHRPFGGVFDPVTG